MDKVATLHQQLRIAAGLLDGAAGLVRDAPLDPAGDHIRRIGEALACIAEVQLAIGKLRPDLEPPFDPVPEEWSSANRRLGPVLVEAYDLAKASQLAKAIAVLERYVEAEPSDVHRDFAKGEIERLKDSDAS